MVVAVATTLLVASPAFAADNNGDFFGNGFFGNDVNTGVNNGNFFGNGFFGNGDFSGD